MSILQNFQRGLSFVPLVTFLTLFTDVTQEHNCESITVATNSCTCHWCADSTLLGILNPSKLSYSYLRDTLWFSLRVSIEFIYLFLFLELKFISTNIGIFTSVFVLRQSLRNLLLVRTESVLQIVLQSFSCSMETESFNFTKLVKR